MVNAIFISVRNSSSRLPNKAILPMVGHPTIWYVIQAMKKSKLADKIILCTSTETDDDILCKIAESCGIEFFRGSLNDKLVRWMSACIEHDVDFFVNVDGDDLFFDVDLADSVIKQYQIEPCDFIDGNGLYNDVYGINSSALRQVVDIKDSEDTEYIRLYFTETGLFDVRRVKNISDKYLKTNIRMTLDYQEDFDFFEVVIKGVAPNDLTLDNILEYIYNNPETIDLNFHLDKLWKENQKKIKHFKIKDEQPTN